MTIGSFSDVSGIIKSRGTSWINIGDTVTSRHSGLDNIHEIEWTVIGIDHDAENSITVRVSKAITHKQFDLARKDHPFGSNRWSTSYIRDWLNGQFAFSFDDDDIDAVTAVNKKTFDVDDSDIKIMSDRIFLLSASEVGFSVNGIVKDEGGMYALYESHRFRKIKDLDGDEVSYWLRSPHPSYSYNVRIVSPSGELYDSGAYYADAVAPACVIT